MSLKASISSDTIFLIATMAIFLIFTIVFLMNWLKPTITEATKASCVEKRIGYCVRWLFTRERPDDWDSVQPFGCEDVGIDEPTTWTECII